MLYLLVVILVASKAQMQFLQLDTDDFIPIFSTVETFGDMQGDMTVDQTADLFVLTLIAPSEDAEGLTLSEIEGTDDLEDLEEIAEDSDNPDALSWV